MNKEELLSITPDKLNSRFVDRLSPKDAEMVAVSLLARSARIKEHGTILSWSEFNENPDILVNRLLARIIVGQFDRGRLERSSPDQVAVLSIENSAAYLALQMVHELERSFRYPKPPRIVRARKLPRGESPSPAMSQRKLAVEVRPITAGGESRTLLASLPDDDEGIRMARTIIIVDDFKATQSTLNGGVELAINLFSQFTPAQDLLIIPTAGLGKPEQAIYNASNTTQAKVLSSITGLDVHFGPDTATGGAFIQANGFGRMVMSRATAADFN